MLELLIEAVLAGFVAHAWINILTRDGMVLSFVKKAMDWAKAKGLPEWIYKPVIGCSMCNAGQIALWYYVISNFGIGLLNPATIITAIPFICVAMVTAQKLDT